MQILIASQVFWLTMMHRTIPKTPGDAASADTEIANLNQMSGEPEEPDLKNVARYLLAVAKLGGYVSRKNDGLHGNTGIWRGLSRLTDIHLEPIP